MTKVKRNSAAQHANLYPEGFLEPMVVDQIEENENQDEEIVLVETAALDLEVLCSSYTGLGRLYRLLFVSERCPPLREEALRLALHHVMGTHNVPFYNMLMTKLNHHLSGGGDGNLPDVAHGVTLPVSDAQWMEAKTKQGQLKLEKLDNEVKQAKVNSIKESVRRVSNELGDHYLDCGELSNALKCYSRARDYCTSHQDILEMCLHVIRVSIYLQNWNHVISYVNKAQATSDSTDAKTVNWSKDKFSIVKTKLACASGLGHLAMKKYKNAAKAFLSASADSFSYTDVLSCANVAVLGGLCALATYNRQELQARVINNTSFKQYLELEPPLREIIFSFYNSKYDKCLKLLQEFRDTYLLDIYLAPHIDSLYSKIRNRALVQYFSPYKSASLTRMASSFNTSVSALEDELTKLILEGQIQGRIDSHNKVLLLASVEERAVTFNRILKLGNNHVDRIHVMMLRAACVKNKLVVQMPSREIIQGDHVSVPM